MKHFKLLLFGLLFLFTTLAFPWGSELCQGCRLDSSALAGPIYTFPNSQMFQQMISTNGTFLFQDDVNRLPVYSDGVKMEIRTQQGTPLRLAYNLNNFVDFLVSSSGSLSINALNMIAINPMTHLLITSGNVGIGSSLSLPSTKLEIEGTVSASAAVIAGTVTANRYSGDGSSLTGVALSHELRNYTANHTLVTADMKGQLTIGNNGAASTINITLPSGSNNTKISFTVVTAKDLKVSAYSGQQIRFIDGLSTLGFVRSNGLGTSWTLLWNENEWVITNLNGTLYVDE